MEKKYAQKLNWFYCSFPSGGKERIVSMPNEEDETTDFLCCTLHEVNARWGEALFETIALTKNIFEEKGAGQGYGIDSRALYRHLEHGMCEENPVKSFLKEWFSKVSEDPARIDTEGLMVSEINKFIEQCVAAKPAYVEKLFQQLACKCYKSIKRAEIVQVNLNNVSDAFSLPDNTLDIILGLYGKLQKEQEEIRDQFRPHMDNPTEFSAELKKWLMMNDSSYDPEEDLVITYHFYKINSLFDLFSATVQEIIEGRKSIKRCACCEKLFVGSRTSDVYCSRACDEAMKAKRKQEENEFKFAKEKFNEIRKNLLEEFHTQNNYIRTKLYVDDEARGDYFKERDQHIQDIIEGKWTKAEFAEWINKERERVRLLKYK